MKYERILKAISDTVWAIHPAKLEEILGVIEARAQGVTIDADYFAEIEARRKSALGMRGRVKVMGIHGTINQRPSLFASGATSLQEFSAEFDDAVRDKAVGGIVFDIDSPGGSVFLLQETVEQIVAARERKPIVAVMNAQAYSAAYWLATAASDVWVTPSGMGGSVGTVATHIDESQAIEEAGLKVTFITQGQYKVEGNPAEPLGDEARAEIQRHVDRYYGQFVQGLSNNRGVSRETVEADFGQGRVVGAEDLLNRKMADRIGTLEQAVRSVQGRLSAQTRMSARRRKVALEKGRHAA